MRLGILLSEETTEKILHIIEASDMETAYEVVETSINAMDMYVRGVEKNA